MTEAFDEKVAFAKHAITEYMNDLQHINMSDEEFFTERMEHTIDTMCIPVRAEQPVNDSEDARQLLDGAVDGYLIKYAVRKPFVKNKWAFRFIFGRCFQLVWADGNGYEWLHCANTLLRADIYSNNCGNGYRWPVRDGVFPIPAKSRFSETK